MIETAVAVVAGVVLGGFVGRRLAARGLTAQNALTGRQLVAYLVLAALAGVFALLYWAHKLPWLPTRLVLAGESAVWPFVQLVAAASLGLLVLLEWPGRRDGRRLATMLAGVAVLGLANGFLVWRSLPVLGLLGASRVVDGVVMQTTSYTCAPATIATLARALGDTTMTERRVAELARTTRSGTTTLSELRAIERLGFAPRFARGLTPESLAAVRQLALLHVDEPVTTTTVRHAVALLAVDAARQTVTLGNPLYGRQVKPWSGLAGYWIGEAVFVGR